MSLIEEELSGLEQFLRLPEIKPALEYYGGRTIQKMSPKIRHSKLQSEFHFRITQHVRPQILGEAFVELRCTVGGRSYVFDLSYFQQSRVPDLSLMDDQADVMVAPDLAIEILTRGQTVRELTRKFLTALRAGLRLGWLIDPIHRQILVFDSDLPPRTLRPGDKLTGDPVIPGFELEVETVFGWIPPASE